MTYNVFDGTLSLTQSINHLVWEQISLDATLLKHTVRLRHYKLTGLAITLTSDLKNLSSTATHMMNICDNWQVSLKALHRVQRY